MAYGRKSGGMKAVRSHKVVGHKGGGFRLDGDSKFMSHGGVKSNSGKGAAKHAGKRAA